MQEKVKGFFQKIKQWWLSAAKKTKILLGAGAAAVLVVIALVLAVSLNQPYTVLFTGLNQTDLTAIVSYLSDNGVTDYQIQGEDTVLVPESQEEQLKAALLIEGYPNSGSGYSMYLDHVSSLTTESERSQLALYDLQDRLAGVIRNFSSVRDAAVFITPGEDHTYVLDSGNVVEASATVIVTMEEGASLTDGQVKAIRNAVSHAVQGLSIVRQQLYCPGRDHRCTGHLCAEDAPGRADKQQDPHPGDAGSDPLVWGRKHPGER